MSQWKTLAMSVVLALGSFNVAWAEKVDCDDESRYPVIEKSELQSLVKDEKVFMIDVNSKKSFKEAKIGNAIHFDSSKKELAQVLPKDKSAMIVAYCGGPKCTAWKRAAEKACEMGYTNIRHFKEGIAGWKEGA